MLCALDCEIRVVFSEQAVSSSGFSYAEIGNI